jgi:hypothetical protein
VLGDIVVVVEALVVVIIGLDVIELLLEIVELGTDELLLEELEEVEEPMLVVEVVIAGKVVAVVLEGDVVEVVLEDEVVDVVDDEAAAGLLYICKAFDPPHHSSAFPLQVKVQALDPGPLPAAGEYPQ